jgi:hypothetical protein
MRGAVEDPKAYLRNLLKKAQKIKEMSVHGQENSGYNSLEFIEIRCTQEIGSSLVWYKEGLKNWLLIMKSLLK